MPTQIIGGIGVQFGATGEQNLTGALARVKSQAKQTSEEMQHGSVAGKKFGLAMQQLSYGIQDAITVWGQTGLRGALIASSNNFAQVFSIMGPLQGAVGGLAVSLTSALIPAFASLLGFTDQQTNAFKKMSQELENLNDIFDKRLQLQKVSRDASMQAVKMDAAALQSEKMQLRAEMPDLEKRAKFASQKLTEEQAKAINTQIPGRGFSGAAGEAWQKLSTMFSSNYSKQTGNVDYKAAFRGLGYDIAKQFGVDIKQRAAGGYDSIKGLPKELSIDQEKLVTASRDPDVIAEILGRRAYDKSQGLTPEQAEKFLSSNARTQMKTEPPNVKKAADEEQDANQEAAMAKARLAAIEGQQSRAFNEQLMQGARPRDYQRLLVQKDYLMQKSQLSDIAKAGDPKFKLLDEIRQKRMNAIEGEASGVMDVSQVHAAIQNTMLRDDDARRTALATEGILGTVEKVAQEWFNQTEAGKREVAGRAANAMFGFSR
jgi:hypothetical protein